MTGPASLARTRDATRARLLEWGTTARIADALCDAWLLADDFLLASIDGDPFDVVVGNPPYVRQERIPAPLLAEYRRRYSTIYDRADLYVPFFERGLDLLGNDGRLAFICANRWMKNKYGEPRTEASLGQVGGASQRTSIRSPARGPAAPHAPRTKRGASSQANTAEASPENRP